jgi:hypothetical protein
VRALPSSKFAAAYSLRFPRITRLRGEAADLADKDWTGVLAEEELVAIVRESGRLPGGRDHASGLGSGIVHAVDQGPLEEDPPPRLHAEGPAGFHQLGIKSVPRQLLPPRKRQRDELQGGQ